MGTKVHYPAETKWKAVQMREEGYSRREVMDTLGIKNVTQLQTWMKWYRNGETHRFHQPVGKQYAFGKGPSGLSEIEQKDIEIRQLRAKILVLEKFVEVSRRWGLK